MKTEWKTLGEKFMGLTSGLHVEVCVWTCTHTCMHLHT